MYVRNPLSLLIPLVFTIFLLASVGSATHESEYASSVLLLQHKYSEILSLEDGGLNYVGEVVWSPDASQIAGYGNQKVLIWDAVTGSLQTSISAEEIASLAWSPDGTLLAGGGRVEEWSIDLPIGLHEGDGAWIWDSKTGEVLTRFSIRFGIESFPHLSSIAWSPDGTILAVGRLDGNVHLWDVHTTNELEGYNAPQFQNNPYSVNSVAWSPDGTKLAVATTCGIDIRFVDDSGLRDEGSQSLSLDSALINQPCENFAIVWHPNGELLASIGENSSIIRIWNLDTEQPVLTFGEDETWDDLDWSPDGAILASVNEAGAVIFWDVETGEELTELPIRNATSFDWSPDGSQFAVGERDGTISIWSAATNGNN